MNDFKFAFRQLLKNPGFTAVAVLTLALGIGANTAVFKLLDAIVLRSLPVREPGRLFFVTTAGAPRRDRGAVPNHSAGVIRRGAFGAAHRLCKRREPAAGQGLDARTGDGRAGSGGRRTLAHRASIADGKPAAGGAEQRDWSRAGEVGH